MSFTVTIRSQNQQQGYKETKLIEDALAVTLDKQTVDEILSAWIRMIGCVAHDVATPLASIRLENNWLKKMLPKVLAGYELAVQHQLLAPQMDKQQLETIETSIDDIEQHVTKIVDFFSELRGHTQKLLPQKESSPFYVGAFIEETIANHPEMNKQPHLLHLDKQHDFQFHGDSLFLKYLLQDLIEQALSRIEMSRQGEMYIWLEDDSQYSILHFKDTADPLNRETVSRAFDSFLVKQDKHIIPGIGFCRLKWLQMGGDITCDVNANNETHFRVQFPKSE
jgi:two-component system CAI-1 autoinducer sensor kinase/phosphatase CqsS